MPLAKRLKNVLTDLYYRAVSLPLLVRLWLIISWWRYRISKQRYRFFKNRAALDHIWLSVEQLDSQEREKQEKKLRKLEKNLLVIEEEINECEEQYFTKKEFFARYWQKMTDQHFGE